MQIALPHQLYAPRAARTTRSRVGTESCKTAQVPRRQSHRCRAASQENKQDVEQGESSAKSLSFVDQVKLMARYDFLSAGLPALAVVSVFVANGQDPWKALSIAFCSTIVSVVVNELVFNGKCE